MIQDEAIRFEDQDPDKDSVPAEIPKALRSLRDFHIKFKRSIK